MSNTKNINVNVQRPPTNIQLGRQGENLATCIIFDCTGLVQLYGDGTAELLHELKSGTVYPVAIKQDGTSVSWIVTASDTATVGAGRAELRWYVGDTLAKSAKFRTSVSSALADTTTETPPAPQQSWVDKVLAAAQEIKDGAISDEKLAAAIAAYLADHPIDAGLDETALAAYLVENGYLTDAALADAIAKALADAKASGQFDGAPGEAGAPGADGADGVGIQSVVQTTTSAEDGGTNVITVTKTDGTSSTFAVRNGSRGSVGPAGADGQPGADGKDGLDGPPGADGKSAYQYAQDGGYTGTEAEFAAKLAEEMPDTLPNPNALTFTGAVTGAYDGSEPVNVEIPSGGGGGASTGEWRLVCDITLEENISKLVISEDSDGNPLSLSLFSAFIESEPIVGSTTNPACQFSIGNKASDIAWGSKLVVAIMGAPKETENKIYNYISSQRFGEQIIMRCAKSGNYTSATYDLGVATENRGGLYVVSGELVKAPTAITHLGLVGWQNPILGAGSRIRIWGVDV